MNPGESRKRQLEDMGGNDSKKREEEEALFKE